MSSIVISGNTSGTVTISAPDVAGTVGLTLPSANGTILTTASTMPAGSVNQAALATGVAGTGPAFSAYANAGSLQSIGAGAYTKITLGAESFDTNNNFASSRFTPTVAGYYQLSFAVGGNVNTELISCLYKNGGLWHYGCDGLSLFISTGSAVVYANGSTDYFELYAYTGLANNIYQTIDRTYFTGVLVRAA